MARNRFSSEKLCFIKVRNRDSGVIYKHSLVPYDHVMTLKLSPNLEVEILKTIGGSSSNRSRSHEDRK